jgi:hypothetical protein
MRRLGWIAAALGLLVAGAAVAQKLIDNGSPTGVLHVRNVRLNKVLG